MANEQENKDGPGATRADTLAEQGAQPVQGKERPGGTGLWQADAADDSRTGTSSSTGQGSSAAAGDDPSGGNTLAGKPGQGKQP